MTRSRFSIGLLLLGLLSGWDCPAQARNNGFLDAPQEAFRQSRRERRPLLIDFSTSWCEACELMQQTTWRNREVRLLLDDFVALAVDGDRNQNLVARYRVEAYPTIMIVEPRGATVLALSGFQDEATLSDHLTAVLERWDELRALAVEATGRRPRAASLIELGDFARGRRALAQAEQLYRRAARSPEASSAELARQRLSEILILTERCREALKIASATSSTDLARRARLCLDQR